MISINKKLIIGLTIAIIIIACWYFCIDTLTFSEMIENDVSSDVSILINLFDFNTKLTRYDIYRLKSKTQKWEERLEEIDSISDSAKRDREYKKVMADMTADPSMKKIIKKVSVFGKDNVESILEVINTF